MTRNLTSSSPVIFKGRHLYSRYDPEKAILAVVDALTLQERTLVLCFSPAACYGLEALIRKLSPHCAVLCIEAEPELYDLAEKSLNPIEQLVTTAPVKLIGPEDIPAYIPHRIRELGVFRSVVRVDMSGGVGFHADLYARIHRIIHTGISRFWQNRLTLTILGRLYAQNLFRNLKRIAHTGAAELPLGKIRRPILVAGAGPSTDALFRTAGTAEALRAHFYVVAVDAALPALLGRKVRVDMAVQVESQIAIDQAYAGCGGAQFLAALALTARSAGARQCGADVGFFATPYTAARFLERLTAGLPPVLPLVPPLGSVGLAAVHLALQCRAGPEVPVYAAGLDFSFAAGVTHCKGSPQEKKQHFTTDRLHPLGDPGAAFQAGTVPVTDKRGHLLYTTAALKGYCESFKAAFGAAPALYDAGVSGLDLGIERRDLERGLGEIIEEERGVLKTVGLKPGERLFPPLTNEIAALTELRAILTGECRGSHERVYNLLREHEYLYLHFPDGWDLTPEKARDTAFLKRVRGEIDSFLKAMT